MIINGRPGLACRTLTKDLPQDIVLAPLPAFELIGDLSVNTGKWMRGMSERLETWVHNQGFAPGWTSTASNSPWNRRWRNRYTSWSAASSAAAAWPPAAPRACTRTLWARSVSTRSPAFASTRGTSAAMPVLPNWWRRGRRVRLHDPAGLRGPVPKRLPLATQIAFLRRRMVAAG